jgi:hypothetical protein
MATKLATILADFRTSLATKLEAGGSSCSLQSATDDDGVALPSGVYFFTIDKENSQKEHIVATLSGVNLTGIKTIARQGTQASNALREHRVGASVTITDFAHILYMNNIFRGIDPLDSTTPLIYDLDPTITDDKHVATKKYVDDTAIAGSAKATDSVYGISKLSVAAVSATEPIVVGQNDPKHSPVALTTLLDSGTDQEQTTHNGTIASGEADSTTKYHQIAQSFEANRTPINGIKLWKKADSGTFTGSVVIELFETAGGDPDGPALATVTIDNATWLAIPADSEFTATFTVPYVTALPTTYWVAISPSTADNSNHPNFGMATAGGYASGAVKFKNSTDDWTAIATIDLYFKTTTDSFDKIAALAGTSGNPSGTNKYVTNDDTAAAATASKLARRNATGDVTVPSTPTADTDAASKAYVVAQSGAVQALISNNWVGVGPTTNKTYINFQLGFHYTTASAVKHWTKSNCADADTGWYATNVNGASDANYSWLTTAGVFLKADTNSAGWSYGKDIITEFELSFKATSGSEQLGWGFVEDATPLQDYDSNTGSVNFSYNTDGKVYAHTADGVNHTNTELVGVTTLTTFQTFRIEYEYGVAARFYINGVLKATIATTLPTAATAIKFGVGGTGTGNSTYTLTAPRFAIEK